MKLVGPKSRSGHFGEENLGRTFVCILSRLSFSSWYFHYIVHVFAIYTKLTFSAYSDISDWSFGVTSVARGRLVNPPTRLSAVNSLPGNYRSARQTVTGCDASLYLRWARWESQFIGSSPRSLTEPAGNLISCRKSKYWKSEFSSLHRSCYVYLKG